MAERAGWNVAREHLLIDNDVSATSGVVRPSYRRLLGLIERGEIDALVVWNTDRLYRLYRDLMPLIDLIKRRPIDIKTVTSGDVDLSSADGRLTAGIKAQVSQHEAERIGERVTMRHSRNAKQGRAHGGTPNPFGYTRTEAGHLVVDEAQAELIREAAGRILNGASLNSIVLDWNSRGIATAGKATHWRPNSLTKVLTSGRIVALREYRGDVIGPADWAPILDRETWERVRSRITHAPIGRQPRRALLAGLVYCANVRADGEPCGCRMRSVSGGDPSNPHPMAKYRSPGYMCDPANGNGCGSNTAKAAGVEAVVLAHVFDAMKVTNVAAVRARRGGAEVGELIAAIEADERLLDEYAEAASQMRPSEYLSITGAIRDRLDAARRKLDELSADVEVDTSVIEGVTPETFDGLDLSIKQAVIRLYVQRVEVAKGKPGRTFDATRVRVVTTD